MLKRHCHGPASAVQHVAASIDQEIGAAMRTQDPGQEINQLSLSRRTDIQDDRFLGGQRGCIPFQEFLPTTGGNGTPGRNQAVAGAIAQAFQAGTDEGSHGTAAETIELRVQVTKPGGMPGRAMVPGACASCDTSESARNLEYVRS